jgi:hypothetical protein
MAITYISQPTDFSRVYDTNRLMFQISSTNYTQPNFRFRIEIWAALDHSSYVELAIVRKRALSDGTCYFNPAEILANYITNDLEIGNTGATECLNSNLQFKLLTLEEYGEPPIIQSGHISSNEIKLYNGLQEYIPYDIVSYGGGNMQWVMNSTSYSDLGSWNNVVGTLYSGKVKFTGGSITGLTQIDISYHRQDGTDAEYLIENLVAGSNFKFESTTDANEYFTINGGAISQSTDHAEITSISLLTSGSTMALTGFTDKKPLNVYNEIGGKWLTDALDYQVDSTDYSNLYYLMRHSDKPGFCKVTVYYWDTLGTGTPAPGGGGDIDLMMYTTNGNNVIKAKNTSISTTQDRSTSTTTNPPGSPIIPTFRSYVKSYVTGFTITNTTSSNEMMFIPSGPQDMLNMGMFDAAAGSGNTWISYEINLTYSGTSNEYYNKYPMRYYRKQKCNKYGPVQLFWMNPHGGFDNYTFYKKNYTSYEIARTMWNHRFSNNYVLGERGATVYKTKAVQGIQLNSDILTASESQILSQLEMSPEVYMVYDYLGTVYKIPYVITDTKFTYKDLKNEKVSTMEINITPAWNRVSQTS